MTNAERIARLEETVARLDEAVTLMCSILTGETPCVVKLDVIPFAPGQPAPKRKAR
jgi:hypothetical protein